MMKLPPRHYRLLAAASLCSIPLLAGTTARAQVCGVVPDVLVALDRSGSMARSPGFPLPSKWNIAMKAVNNLGSSFSGQLGLGLMLFPATGSCSPGSVRVGCSASSAGAIRSAMLGSFPSGNTPIASSLSVARRYLLSIRSGKPQYVILVTDGMETCRGNPTSATQSLTSSGIKTYVVGFGSGVNPGALQSMARVGGTGRYYQADNLTQLTAALQSIANSISCCGNGTIDQGERCDTSIASGRPGACPRACDDRNVCTTDKLSGSKCGARCTYTPIVRPKSGDGCCPKGATYATDKDCPNLCGNRRLDSGERCDTAIAPGRPGACPTLCDDNNPCTADRKVGTGCSARCEHANLCGCGNGRVDPGELCDTAIAAGTPGACPRSCDDGQACTIDRLEGKTCLAKCSHRPAQAMLGKADGCCPTGLSSAKDADCPPPCGPDRTHNCVDVCANVTCKDGHYCRLGSCAPWPAGGQPPSGGSHNPGGGPQDSTGAAGGTVNVSGGCAVGGTHQTPPWPLILLLLLGICASASLNNRSARP